MADKSPRSPRQLIEDGHLEIEEPPLALSHQPTPFTVPQEILSFIPNRQQTHRQFHNGVEIRQIFLNTPLEPQEVEMMKAFDSYCSKVGFKLPDVMTPLAMRIVLFNKRKFPQHYLEKSVEHARMMRDWRRVVYPVKELDFLPELKQGVIYWVGRDKSFRPLAVVRLSRMSKELANDPQRFKTLTVFVFEWIVRYGFIPGKVETCRVLVDLADLPLRSIPLKAVKEMGATLTKQFPFRLDKMFIVNAPRVVMAFYNIVKVVLTEVQQQKMIFMSPSTFKKELLADYHPSQLEVQYGGTLPDLSAPNFYPFAFPPGPFLDTPQETTRVPDCWKAIDSHTIKGSLWLDDKQKTPLQWSPLAPVIFDQCGLLFPTGEKVSDPKGEVSAAALDLSIAALAVREEELSKDAPPNSPAGIRVARQESLLTDPPPGEERKHLEASKQNSQKMDSPAAELTTPSVSPSHLPDKKDGGTDVFKSCESGDWADGRPGEVSAGKEAAAPPAFPPLPEAPSAEKEPEEKERHEVDCDDPNKPQEPSPSSAGCCKGTCTIQ